MIDALIPEESPDVSTHLQGRTGLADMPFTSSSTLQHDLPTIFRGAPVKSLLVDCEHCEEDMPGWTATLSAFPALEQVELLGEGILTPFWSALRQISEVAIAGGQQGSEPLPCPALRCIKIEGVFNVDKETLDEIVGCLRVRAEHGSRLEELILMVHIEDPNDLAHEVLHPTYLPQLQALVGQATYENL